MCVLCPKSNRSNLDLVVIFSHVKTTWHLVDMSLGMSQAQRLDHERIWETSHLVSIPVHDATYHSLCSQPSYPHHKTTGTGCMCYYPCTDANETEISNISVLSTFKTTMHHFQKELVRAHYLTFIYAVHNIVSKQQIGQQNKSQSQ